MLSKLSSPAHPSLSVFLSFPHLFLLHHHCFNFLLANSLFLTISYFPFTQHFYSPCLTIYCTTVSLLSVSSLTIYDSFMCFSAVLTFLSPALFPHVLFILSFTLPSLSLSIFLSPSSSTSHCLCGVSGNRRGIVASTHHPIIFSNANRERQPVNKMPF